MLLPSGEPEAHSTGIDRVLFYHAEASGVGGSLCVCLCAHWHTHMHTDTCTCRCVHRLVLKVLIEEETVKHSSSTNSLGECPNDHLGEPLSKRTRCPHSAQPPGSPVILSVRASQKTGTQSPSRANPHLCPLLPLPFSAKLQA